jgi:hypothetical protein
MPAWEHDHYRVVVADNGVGLPEGVMWPVPGKLGALIFRSLRENAKTNLRVESACGQSMRVTIGLVEKCHDTEVKLRALAALVVHPLAEGVCRYTRRRSPSSSTGGLHEERCASVKSISTGATCRNCVKSTLHDIGNARC